MDHGLGRARDRRSRIELFDADIFHPRRRTLALSENLLGSAIPVAPLNWLGQPVLAYNVALLLGLALSGIGVTLWVRQLTGSTTAGLVAGIVWAFAPPKLDHLPQIQLLTGQGLAFGLWLATLYVDRGKRRYLIGAAALLGWQYLSGIHLTLLALPTVALYFVALLWLRSSSLLWRDRKRLMADVALAGLVGMAFVVPARLPYLELGQEGFRRTLEATLEYAARPRSLLAPTWVNRAPHLVALHQRFRLTEANLFPGVLASALFGWSMVVAWRAGGVRHARPGPPTPIRRGLHRSAVVVAVVAGLLVLACGLLSPLGHRVTAVTLLFQFTATLAPAVLLAVATPVALLTLPGDRDARDRQLLAALCGCLALVAFLLALGPVVKAFGGMLGPGPHRFLYEAVLPFRSIRAVGRFGLAMLLWVAAGAGIGTAALLETARARGLRPGRIRVAAGVGLALLSLEYWSAPLPHHDVSSPDAATYEHIAGLDGVEAVIHVPFVPGSFAADATIYMLGSTRHWRPLVNGYSGFTPLEVRPLVGMTPFTGAFYRYLREQFAADTMVVHRRYLGDGLYAGLEDKLRSDPRNVLEVASVGDTLVARLRTDQDRGGVVTRRYSNKQLTGKSHVAFQARLLSPGTATLEVAWGSRVVQRLEIGARWSDIETPPPTPNDALADGSYRLTWAATGPTVPQPLGSSGSLIHNDLLVEAQRLRLALAVNDAWELVTSEPGVLVGLLDAEGRSITGYSEHVFRRGGFQGAAALLRSLSPGQIVAVLFDRSAEATAPVPTEFRDALRVIGASTERVESRLYVALGRVGAPPGSALEHGGSARAWVRVGPAEANRPQIAVRRIRRAGRGEPQG